MARPKTQALDSAPNTTPSPTPVPELTLRQTGMAKKPSNVSQQAQTSLGTLWREGLGLRDRSQMVIVQTMRATPTHPGLS